MKKAKKNPSCLKNPRTNPRLSDKTQEPKIGSKNPRSREKTQAVATLVTIAENAGSLSSCSIIDLEDRNRKLEISTAPTKSKLWEPACSHVLIQNKIDRQRVRSRASRQTVRRLW